MSMVYKIHVFDYVAFTEELSDILMQALENGQLHELVAFVTSNIAKLKEPYEGGNPLSPDWQTKLKSVTVQEWGDIALTKFYDPSAYGLVATWLELNQALENIQYGLSDLILGHTFGNQNATFDPGLMGSFFQSPLDVEENLKTLQHVINTNSHLLDDELLDALKRVIIAKFQEAANVGKGLYITF